MSLQNSHQISDVKVMLVKGADGKGIASIEKTGTSGLVDTYTITYDDGAKTTFTVTNGNGITSIEKTATHGLVDTYTIYFDNGDTETYEVTNGQGGGMSARLLINSDAGSTVTVTTPSGTVLTAQQVTGSTTQWYCDTTEYGVHTIDAVLSGDDAQVTVTVDNCKIYNIDDNHFHATINVKYPYGATCRCQGGTESYYADGSPYAFSVHSANTFTITVVYDGQTYTDTVTVTTSGTSFDKVVPSPSTAPVNDINVWLSMGEVSGTYSTLADILADSTALSTLMASTDAVDYLVRCTSWVSDITGNQSAMSYIGLNNYCSNTLLADSTWMTGICNSSYFESVLNVKVPTMTSNTTPSGVASASSNSESAWYTFDNALSNWQSAQTVSTGGSQWIQYQFGSAISTLKQSAISQTTLMLATAPTKINDTNTRR